jgi:hypothetical protein
MVSTPERYRRHRFLIEVVEHCIWLYFGFSLSYRTIEEMMAVRGVRVTYEPVREWCQKFGALYAFRYPKLIGLTWSSPTLNLFMYKREGRCKRLRLQTLRKLFDETAVELCHVRLNHNSIYAQRTLHVLSTREALIKRSQHYVKANSFHRYQAAS